MKKCLIFLLLIFVCSGTVPISVLKTTPGSETFLPAKVKTFKVSLFGEATNHQKRQLSKAIQEWNELAGTEFISLSWGEGDIVVRFEEFDLLTAPQAIGVADLEHYGDYCPIHIQPWIRSYKVVLHEIGHCLGFLHSQDFYSVMYFQALPWFYRGTQFTTEIQRIVKEAYGKKASIWDL